MSSLPDYLRNGAVGLYQLFRPGESRVGYEALRAFTVDAREVVVIDPYFFASNSARQSQDRRVAFVRATCIDRNREVRIHVIRSRKHDNVECLAAMRAACVDHQGSAERLTLADTGEVHDRVWIVNRAKGKVVGTSLGGIGARAAFMLNLPRRDLRDLLDYLRERRLLP